MADGSTEIVETTPVSRVGRSLGRGLLAILVLIALWYVVGMIWLHRIADDPNFFSDEAAAVEGSRTVAVAAAVIDREVNQNRWIANDPFFQPGYMLDNMPNFQIGIVQAMSRFAIELKDQIARVRGSSQIDEDANDASGRLNYPGDVWIFEWSSTPVQPSSESQYRKAIEDFRRYNERLASGSARFEPRSDNLLATLDRIASDIGSSSAAVTEKVDGSARSWIDFTADDLFYENKGRLYGYYLLLREMRHDFAGVIEDRDLSRIWDEMLVNFQVAATLQPWVVVNGGLDSQLRPSHLASQGFLLLRARTQLREITNILLK